MLPLFYTDVTGLDRARDRLQRVNRQETRFGFTATSHLCPCLAAEFASGSRDYPIVFLMENGKPAPVFLFGLRNSQNLMVTPEGGWTGGYLPRYLDRFPFIIAELPGEKMVLAMERSAVGDSDGHRLFEDDGGPTAFLEQMRDTSERYAADARASDAFSQRLLELDLLKSVNVEVKRNGDSFGWHDLFVVDEAKMMALPDADLLGLARQGYLAAIYSHLLSLQSFRRLEALDAAAQSAGASAAA